MSLLDKIAAVEIKADTRISEEDRVFCQTQQKAYETAKASLLEIRALWKSLVQSQEELLTPIMPDSYSKETYIRLNGFSSIDLRNKIEYLPELFINSLVQYFNRKYHVSVSEMEIKKVMLPDSPQFDWEKSRSNEYHKQMRELTLRYEDVVEQIFVQLGGRTFEERAVDELKEKCHKFSWNTYRGTPEYELQNETIHFNGYACSFEAWTTRNIWKINDGMKDVLRALAHYETRQMDYLPKDIAFLIGYDDKCSSSYDFDYDKLKKIRMFKNHRVDVKFASKELAYQFAEQYLGIVA